jgi:Txe/YoeB family toxin of Txe-Axe toxin-antitoxin module
MHLTSIPAWMEKSGEFRFQVQLKAVPLAYRTLNYFSRRSKMDRFCIIDLHINSSLDGEIWRIPFQVQLKAVPLAYRTLNNFSRRSEISIPAWMEKSGEFRFQVQLKAVPEDNSNPNLAD